MDHIAELIKSALCSYETALRAAVRGDTSLAKSAYSNVQAAEELLNVRWHSEPVAAKAVEDHNLRSRSAR